MEIEDPEESNLWRETSFAFHLVKQAINPLFNLTDCVNNWENIAKGLAEGKRIRINQIYEFFSINCDYSVNHC